jgi:hypothetical protein
VKGTFVTWPKTDRRNPPLVRPEELSQPLVSIEMAWRLAAAESVVVEASTLAADLAMLGYAGTGPPTRDAAGAWLVDHMAIISASQAAQTIVNEPIRTSGVRVEAFRPPRYGRSLVVPADVAALTGKPGRILVDVKGCGIAPGRLPAAADHQNGLLLLSQALEEYVMQQVLETALAAAGVDVRGVPVYGLLMLDFLVAGPAGGRQPAGLLVRRSHRRPLNGVELAPRGSTEQRVQLMVELILRRYGLTSVSAATRLEIQRQNGRLVCRYAGVDRYDVDDAFLRGLLEDLGREPPQAFEAANIQYAHGPSDSPLDVMLVDFGHYEARERFDLPLLSLVRDRRLQWGGVLFPEDPGFVQPDPRERMNVEVLGYRRPSEGLRRWAGLDGNIALPGPAVFGLAIAHDLARRLISSVDVEAAARDFVDRAVNGRQPATPRAPTGEIAHAGRS